MKVIWIFPLSDLMFCDEHSAELIPFVLLSWETAALLPGTAAKILSFLQSISACQDRINGEEGRSLASFNFAYFQPDFIKVQAHYIGIVCPSSPRLEFLKFDL